MTTVIYADILFIINICVDYFCLYSVYKLFCLKVKYLRIIISSLIGGIYGIFYFLIDYMVIHIIVYLLIVMIAFDITEKKFLLKSLIFIVFSATLGGITTALINLSGNLNYIPFFLVVSAVFTFCLFYLKKKSNVMTSIDLEIYLNDKIIKESAFVDSGNLLKDIYTGKSVILIKKNALDDDFDVELQRGFRIIPIEYRNLNIIKCFKPNLVKAIINKKCYVMDVLIAIDETSGLYDDKKILIPLEMIGELL